MNLIFLVFLFILNLKNYGILGPNQELTLKKIKNQIEIYQASDGQTKIEVTFEQDTVWLDTNSMAAILDVQRPAIVKHIGNIYKSGELKVESTCSILEQVAADGKKRKINFYNVDMVISVGYRVNSTKATLFRQWATQRLKEYLVQGYAINEKRLAQKQQEVQTLKDGIRILGRAIEFIEKEEKPRKKVGYEIGNSR